MAVGLKAPDRLLPVAGIRLARASAGIYRRARPDLVLIEAAPGSSAAAVFTSNAFCAAPVSVARAHLATGMPRYLLINAGNANAGTGAAGVVAAQQSCRAVAQLGGCTPEQVLPFSTGVIGEHLPLAGIEAALPGLHAALAAGAWLDCAHAIMTTDTLPKGASRRIDMDAAQVTLTGIAKGAGMIHPQLATLLAFVATDAAIAPALLRRMLQHAADGSFNRISVDGDTSTNDALVLLASGHAGSAPIRDWHDPRRGLLQAALDELCRELAQAVVRDGEGATKFISLKVTGGADAGECLLVARAVAVSPLVKTAFFASDANWGRIVAAIGNAGLGGLDPARVRILLDDVCIVQHGGRAPGYQEADGRRVMQQEEISVTIDLGRGDAATEFWTCDFSHEYVRINAEYRS